MSEQPMAVVETPKRKLAIRLPSRSTILKSTSYLAVFGAGALVGAKKVRDACARENDTTETAGQTDI